MKVYSSKGWIGWMYGQVSRTLVVSIEKLQPAQLSTYSERTGKVNFKDNPLMRCDEVSK